MGLDANDRQNKRDDSRTTEALIKLALLELDGDARWEFISILQFRGSMEVLQAASMLCESNQPEERMLGVEILGQLGIPERTFPDASVSILLNLLAKEQCSDVLGCIGVALGHIQQPKAVEPLAKLKSHPIAAVRFGVAYGLLCNETELAIETLIALSADQDTDVRNWATFGLGSQITVDTAPIRAALFQRLLDQDFEIRGEAMLGLAVRKDPRVISFLIEELTSDDVGILAVEAAKELGDATLHPILVALKKWWDVDNNLLEEALESCKNKIISL